jgi:hypothetical protein
VCNGDCGERRGVYLVRQREKEQEQEKVEGRTHVVFGGIRCNIVSCPRERGGLQSAERGEGGGGLQSAERGEGK